MNDRIKRKSIVFGIIVLFMGASIVPISGQKETHQGLVSSIKNSDTLYPSMINSCSEDEWSKLFGGQSYDAGYSVQQTNDAGYIIAGVTYSYDGGHETAWLIKTDVDGNEQWNHTYGYNHASAQSVKQTTDGGYILAGNQGSNVLLIKTDSVGQEEWDTNYSMGYESECWSVDQTADGGYVVSGTGLGIIPMDYHYIFLMKTDANGTLVWSKHFGSFTSNSYGYSVEVTDDGGCILTGQTFEYGVGDGDLWLIKTSAAGVEEWNRTFDGPKPGDNIDLGISVHQTMDTGYIITGLTAWVNGEDADSDTWLLKTDDTGHQEWNKTFGGPLFDLGYCVDQTQDGGYILTGETKSFGAGDADLWVIKTDPAGNEQANITFGGSAEDIGYSIQQTTATDYIITGSTASYGAGSADVWLIKLKIMINQPPSPPLISGPTSGKAKIAYQWNFTSIDPNNDDIFYEIDWGDGTVSGWYGPYHSGGTMAQSHPYEYKGTYTIKSKAKDGSGAESDWATLSVTMPYSPNPNAHPLFLVYIYAVGESSSSLNNYTGFLINLPFEFVTDESYVNVLWPLISPFPWEVWNLTGPMKYNAFLFFGRVTKVNSKYLIDGRCLRLEIST